MEIIKYNLLLMHLRISVTDTDEIVCCLIGELEFLLHIFVCVCAPLNTGPYAPMCQTIPGGLLHCFA